jgi:O-antigen/teichoic acid export membrane protein
VPADDRRSVTARLSLPEGTLAVGAGLILSGIGSVLFLRIVGKALDDRGTSQITALWFTTFALAPGLFLPLEQELGRSLSARRTRGHGGRPLLRKILILGTSLAAIITVATLAAGSWLSHSYFDRSWVMVIALILAVVSYAPVHLSRGTCSGMGRFQSYAIVIGGDGLVRIVACIVLGIAGIKSVGAYAFAVALAPLLGVLYVASRGQLKLDDGPPAEWREVTPNLGWLLIGSLMAAALVNAGPIAMNVLAAKGAHQLKTDFGKGVILARIPLFMFQAVQAALLPRLARLAASGEMSEFRRGFNRLMKLVVLVGGAGVAGAFVLGPFVMEHLFAATLSRRTLAVLALGSALYMVAIGSAQAVIALHGHAMVALGWTIGMVSFVVAVAAIHGDVVRRVEISLLIASAAAMIAFLLALRVRLASGARFDPDSMVEAALDFPVEG